jgi:translocator protein
METLQSATSPVQAARDPAAPAAAAPAAAPSKTDWPVATAADPHLVPRWPTRPSERDPPRQPSTGAPRAEAAGLARPWAAALAATALVWPAVAGRLWGPQRLVPGVWYRLLRKPSFQPPDAVIPMAWSLIDLGLAAGAYRLLRRPSTAPRNRALGWWALNVGLIGGWSGLFFGRRNLPGSTALAAAMVGTGAAYVAQAQQVDKPAAAAGVPYIGWVAFATVLTAALWRRNR